MSAKLEKFVREEYRPNIDLYTSTNATIDFFMRRYNAQFKAEVDALPAGTVLDARDDVDGITKEQIQGLFLMFEGLMAAQPVGSTDALIAQRVSPMRISG